MTAHDSIYHRLFSDPGMVAQLLVEFIDAPWIADLDLSAMPRLNGDFTSDKGDRPESDVIWRIPLKRGGDAYLLLMLEFQSTPDRWMALRALVYAGLLWQSLAKERPLSPDGLLPPVFPWSFTTADAPGRCPNIWLT